MNDAMLPLPGLSPFSGKSVVAAFDGGLLSSDGGVLVLREAERFFVSRRRERLRSERVGLAWQQRLRGACPRQRDAKGCF